MTDQDIAFEQDRGTNQAADPPKVPEIKIQAADIICTDPIQTPSKMYPEIINLNVSGQAFATTRSTIMKDKSWLLAKLINGELSAEVVAKDQEGRYFIDRDSKMFATILSFLRSGTLKVPKYGTNEWDDLWQEAEYYQLQTMLEKMERSALDELSEISTRDVQAIEAEQARLHQHLTAKEVQRQRGREIEQIKIEMQRLQYEKAKKQLMSKHQNSLKQKKEYVFNLIIAGVTGTGKSSTLNTLLDSQQCMVSGAQAQGTKGTHLMDGMISGREVVSFIDTQGLGADTSISDAELLEKIILATESIMKLRIINNILLTFDLNQRIVPSTMANQLTLVELFSELQQSCFLCFTKWNTNSVLSEWNKPLHDWIRRNRKKRSVQEIEDSNDPPPTYETLYQAYCNYIVTALANDADGGAFSKMGTYLGFFEARVLWMYNLDNIQVEDKESGELEAYHYYLYNYYRKRALDTLRQGSTVVNTSDLLFLKSDKDTMKDVACRLIRTRDSKLRQLELAGAQADKRERLKGAFVNFVGRQKRKIADANFNLDERYIEQVADIAEIMKTTHNVGCTIS